MSEKDTLAALLFNRYATESPLWGKPWSELPERTKVYWRCEADDALRAVARTEFGEPQ